MKRILIVDDDKDLLYGLTALLTNKGYKIKTVDDGRMASWITKDFTPDLILLDLNFPNADGKDICHRLKEDSKTRHIPILIISGDSEAKDALIDCPVDAFMAKPLNLVCLYNKLEVLTLCIIPCFTPKDSICRAVSPKKMKIIDVKAEICWHCIRCSNHIP